MAHHSLSTVKPMVQKKNCLLFLLGVCLRVYTEHKPGLTSWQNLKRVIVSQHEHFWKSDLCLKP